KVAKQSFSGAFQEWRGNLFGPRRELFGAGETIARRPSTGPALEAERLPPPCCFDEAALVSYVGTEQAPHFQLQALAPPHRLPFSGGVLDPSRLRILSHLLGQLIHQLEGGAVFPASGAKVRFIVHGQPPPGEGTDHWPRP